MASNNFKNKTILESLIEMNSASTIYKDMHDAGYPGYSRFAKGYSGEDSTGIKKKNQKKNEKKIEKKKWKKYVNLIEKIINEYLPEMYLIENGANYKTFKSYDHDDYIHVQYYKDNVVKKFCEITYVEDDCFTYVEKCSTPKMVYKKFRDFISLYSTTRDYIENEDVEYITG